MNPKTGEKMSKKRVAEGAANVSTDLGLSNPEKSIEKSSLVYEIAQIIKRRKLTQTEAAMILRIDQPQVSALMRGRFYRFSLERLLRFMDLLGRRIRYVFEGKDEQAKSSSSLVSRRVRNSSRPVGSQTYEKSLLNSLSDIRGVPVSENEYKSLGKVVLGNLLPVVLPRLGGVLAAVQAYQERRVFDNLTQLIKVLDGRVHDLEEKFASAIDDGGERAEIIAQIVEKVQNEQNREKISFYAGVITGVLEKKNYEWDRDLRAEFENTICRLSGPELLILQHLHNRKPSEEVPLSLSGGKWLGPDITMNSCTMAWLESLISKGLLIDASVERVQNGLHVVSNGPVKSRSFVRLSSYARMMIDYMKQVQPSKIDG
jgi:predicted XRE-type DNA-binding protein